MSMNDFIRRRPADAADETPPEDEDPNVWALERAARGVLHDPSDVRALMRDVTVDQVDGKPDPRHAAQLVGELVQRSPHLAIRPPRPTTRDFDAGSRGAPPPPTSVNDRIRAGFDAKRASRRWTSGDDAA